MPVFNAPEKPTGQHFLLDVAASTVISAGELVGRNAAGNAIPASATAGVVVIGRAEHDVDNSTGAIGAKTVNVKAGCFKYNNHTSNTITKASVGRLAYIVDSVTVATTGTNTIIAGIVNQVEADGVWIDTRRGLAAV